MDFEEIQEQNSIDDNTLSEDERFSLKKSIFSIITSGVLAVAIFLFVTVFYKPTLTHGHSMEPTLSDGDRAIAAVWNYKPANGDIVVIKDIHKANKYLVKRIISIAGDTIDIDFSTGEVFRNGELLVEPYILEKTTAAGDVRFPVTIPEGCVFVMGDNRNQSTDSRTTYTGMISEKNIEGKVIYRFYPLEKMGKVE